MKKAAEVLLLFFFPCEETHRELLLALRCASLGNRVTKVKRFCAFPMWPSSVFLLHWVATIS